jgi:hypothetical protein
VRDLQDALRATQQGLEVLLETLRQPGGKQGASAQVQERSAVPQEKHRRFPAQCRGLDGARSAGPRVSPVDHQARQSARLPGTKRIEKNKEQRALAALAKAA